MTAGRPAIYSKELADQVLEKLALGRSLRSVLQDEGMPAMTTVFKWLREIPEFTQQYTRAKMESANADHDKLDDIAQKVLDGEVDPNAARVAADIIKWSTSKKDPKRYGQVVTQQITGSLNLSNLTDEELKAKLAALMAISNGSVPEN